MDLVADVVWIDVLVMWIGVGWVVGCPEGAAGVDVLMNVVLCFLLQNTLFVAPQSHFEVFCAVRDQHHWVCCFSHVLVGICVKGDDESGV